MVKTIIYALTDPRTDEIRYVGKTCQTLKARISGHLMDKTRCHRTNWLAELKAKNLRPSGVVLCTVEGDWPWQEEEIYWIAKLKKMGARLTNNTSGGDGVPDLPKETRERMRQTWLGRKHKPETIEKLKAARALRVTSDATRAKMSQSQKGRQITWGDAIANAVRKVDADTALKIKQRLDAGERVKDLADEFKMHRTSISKINMGTYFKRT